MSRETQSVSGSEGAQVVNQKAALREVLDGTLRLWGMELSRLRVPKGGLKEKYWTGGSTLGI